VLACDLVLKNLSHGMFAYMFVGQNIYPMGYSLCPKDCFWGKISIPWDILCVPWAFFR
jgi:hypothetical protein